MKVGDYVKHLRPAEWPIMAAHTAVGWLLASGLRWPDGTAWLGIAAWVVALNGGTLALNSAFDRDEGDIAFLKSPPPPPAGLAVAAVLLMLSGLAVTWRLPSGYRVVYIICFLMSIAYSVPPLRLKAVAGADWIINMLGFGALSPIAAWMITGRPLIAQYSTVLWAFCPLFAALYPLTQFYQMDEDRQRGDLTFALRLGVRWSLGLASVCTGVAFGMLTMSAWRAGWRGGDDLLRWGVLAVAGVAWGVVLAPWYVAGRVWSSSMHQRAMYHALAAWALTDVAVLLGWAVR